MKKINLTLLIIAGCLFNAYSQSGQKWSANGNTAASGDFLGTTNNEPLIFKSNNSVVLRLKPNGELMIKSLDLNSNAPSGLVLTSGQGIISRLNFNTSTNQVLFSNGTWGAIPTSTVLSALKLNNLAGVGNRLVQVDASGNLIQLPQGTSNQYLAGNGTWVNVPNVNNLWGTNGTSMYYNNGYVGIGTNTPLFPLDVIGDARISNNLYVGGGVVISDKISAITEIKGWDFKVDNDISIEGSSRLKGATRLDQGFTFDGTKGIKYLAGIGSNPSIINLGGSPQASIAQVASNCAASWGNLGTQAPNWFQIYEADVNSNYISNGSILNLQSWTGGSSIDATSATPNTGGLLLNYWCGNNTYINTGVNGGTVSMGKKVEIGSPYPPNQNTALNIKSEIDYSGLNLSTNYTHDYGYNTALFVNRDLTKAIGVFKTTGATSTENFVVFGNGSTHINTSETVAFTITNKSSNEINFKVNNTGFVYAREMNIMIGTFPDYVFKKDYQLTPLLEVEKFIQSNNHLKGFEKASVYEKDGMPIGEVVRLQQEKIEELTLYLIELKKEINNLKNAK